MISSNASAPNARNVDRLAFASWISGGWVVEELSLVFVREEPIPAVSLPSLFAGFK